MLTKSLRRRVVRSVGLLLAAMLSAGQLHAQAIVVSKQTAAAFSSLSPQPSATDSLNGNVATRILGGFHPIVVNASDKEASFTDGAGLGGVKGLLIDYPSDGIDDGDHTDAPAWSGFWVLAGGAPRQLNEVRVFSGAADGRTWHHYDLYTTTDPTPSASSTWTLQQATITPANFGTPNGGNVGGCRTTVTRSGGLPIAASVTAMRIDFFAVAQFASDVFRDSTATTMVSPFIAEVDAFFTVPPTPTPTPTATPTPTGTPTPTPTGTPTFIGVTNGGFEGTYVGGVAPGWTAWKTAASPTITYGRATNNKFQGSYSQYWFTSSPYPAHDGGVYQRIAVDVGQHYRVRARMKRFINGSIQRVRFGVDPTGGTVGDAPSVQYVDLTPVRGNHWALYDRTIQATGPFLTLFARGGTTANGVSDDTTYVDWVTVEPVAGPLPTPTPATNQLVLAGQKGITPPVYFPWTGNLLTEQVANTLQSLGCEMVRIEFIKEANCSINYAAYEEIVDRCAARGIAVLGLLDYQTVCYANDSEWETQPFRDLFTARCQEIVTHFANRPNKIRHWEIWNEPDLDARAEGGPKYRIEPNNYGALIAQVYPAIKAIDPGATVVSGGLAAKGFMYEDDPQTPRPNYLKQMYAAPAIVAYRTTHGRYPWDAIGVHPYPEQDVKYFSAARAWAPIPGMNNAMNDCVKAVMNQNGERFTPVWVTEMGWSTAAVSQANQATHLTDAFLMLDRLVDYQNPNDGPYVQRIIWFCMRDFVSGAPDLWGLQNSDGTVNKPSYTSYQQLGKGTATPTPTPTPTPTATPTPTPTPTPSNRMAVF